MQRSSSLRKNHNKAVHTECIFCGALPFCARLMLLGKQTRVLIRKKEPTFNPVSSSSSETEVLFAWSVMRQRPQSITHSLFNAATFRLSSEMLGNTDSLAGLNGINVH